MQGAPGTEDACADDDNVEFGIPAHKSPCSFEMPHRIANANLDEIAPGDSMQRLFHVFGGVK
jgi:hypothetical protein